MTDIANAFNFKFIWNRCSRMYGFRFICSYQLLITVILYCLLILKILQRKEKKKFFFLLKGGVNPCWAPSAMLNRRPYWICIYAWFWNIADVHVIVVVWLLYISRKKSHMLVSLLILVLKPIVCKLCWILRKKIYKILI